jgi:membrane protein implicated in regulation of membrane protease activity
MLFNIWSFLTVWYNLPFTVLLGLGLFVAVLQLSGLGGDDDSEADLQDGDLDQDLDSDVADDVDQDAADDGSDSDQDTGSSDAEQFSPLSFIGAGKVPLLVVLLILFSSVGLAGWLLNSLIQAVLGSFPGLLVFVTMPIAFVGGALFTSRVARFIGMMVPPLTTTASRAQALVGMTGTVTSPFVDEKYGMVRLRDQGSTMITVFAITEDAQAIPRGEKVLLVSYDADGRRYQVTRK